MVGVEGAFPAGTALQSCALSCCVSFALPNHSPIPDRLPEGLVTFMFSVKMSMLASW